MTSTPAPAGGWDNLSAWVRHDDPTWREAVIGSATLSGLLVGAGVVVVAVVLSRRRARPGR